MANVNIVSIFTIVMLFTTLFTGMTYVLDDVDEQNTRLSTQSQIILTQFNTDVNTNLPVSSLTTPTSSGNVSSGGESEDFSREYRESKAIINQDKSRLEKVFSVPQIFVNSIGIDTDNQITFYLTMIGIFLAFIIGIAIYIAFRTGQVQN